MKPRPVSESFFLVFAATLSAGPILGQVPDRRPVEVFRLGGIDAPTHSAFSREPGIVAGAGERIYVRESQPPSIMVFSPNGEFVHRIGRDGEGPGEFKIITAHGVLGDSLWVIDGALMRLSLFDREGEFVASTPLPSIERRPYFPGPQGLSALLLEGGALQLPNSAPVNTEKPIEAPIYFGDRSLEGLREVGRIVSPQGLLIPGVGTFWLRDIPNHNPITSIASSGIGWVSVEHVDPENGQASVSRFDHRANRVWEREIESDLIPVSEAIRQELLSQALEMFDPALLSQAKRYAGLQGLPGPEGTREELVERALLIPRSYPLFDTALLGHDGSVWLRYAGENREATWLVLDPDGQDAFTIRLPRDVHLREASLETAWVTYTDELGVPFVMRLDVRD